MPHDSVLILKVRGLLEQEYGPHEYDYVIEKAIPGTRMYPDIAVVGRSSNRIQCAVEIGYTRPEKLTAYRHELNIPDVRWYDRQGNLHADLVEKLVQLELAPGGPIFVYDQQQQHKTKTVLTDKKIAGLKPAAVGRRYIVHDVVIPGLGVRVTDKGHKTFVLGMRAPGSKHYVRRELGEVGAITLADVRARAREWLLLVKQGIDPAIPACQARAGEGIARRILDKRKLLSREDLTTLGINFRTGYLRQLILRGAFPAPVMLGRRTQAWVKEEIVAWLSNHH